MKLFKSIIEKAAEKLILAQFECDYNRGHQTHPPAAQFAREAIENKMEGEDIKEKIDLALKDAALDQIIQKHLSVTIRKMLNEELIKRIVQKINEVQIAPK